MRQFCKELSPGLLRAAAALGGFAPPPEDGFDYCELGCGTGDTVNTLAAAYPGARFVGVDFNAEHVAFARGLAERAGLRNVRFLERDVADLARDDLPAFDYVCAHGVLAWIAPSTRAAMLDVAAARLKPGGLLYVSYNAMPGWAAVEPLRRLMLDASAGIAGTSLDRARHALGAAKALCEARAEYFEANPAAKEMLATTLRMGLAYAAHEYLGADWHPMYFADVAGEMGARGLRFVAQLPLYLNDRALTLPGSVVELLRGVADRAEFERLKDFAINEFFRGDLYTKDRAPDPARRDAYLEGTPFCTLVPADAVRREVRLRHHTLRFDGPLFDALVARLSAEPCTVADLARDASLATHGAGAVREGVLRLLLGEQIAPMRAAAGSPAAAYNRVILEQRLSVTSPVVLAAPAAGTGVVVPTLHAIALRLLTWVEPAAREEWIRAFVARQPVNLQAAGRAVEDPSEQARIIAQEVERFRVRRLPKLAALGVVELA